MLRRMKRLVILALLGATAQPVLAAGASNFTLVNGSLSIRRAGTLDWKPLGTAPSAGARSSMNFSDPDCAFDIRANVAGAGNVTWADVNLCAVLDKKLHDLRQVFVSRAVHRRFTIGIDRIHIGAAVEQQLRGFEHFRLGPRNLIGGG